MNKTQTGVAIGMALGACLTAAGLSLTWLWPGLPEIPKATKARLRIWLSLSVMITFWLFIAIAQIARHRFFSESDIDGSGLSGGTEKVRVLQALLQNTVEQAFLAIPVYGAWLFIAPSGWGMLPVIFCGYFCLGRILFFNGYAKGATHRALGFTLTFYPTVAMLLLLIPMALRPLLAIGQG